MTQQIIEKFLSQYPSVSTQRTYNAALKLFFENNKQQPDKYFDNGRDYSEDVRKFQQSLITRPPKTAHTYVMAIKSFLIENNVDLGARYWRKLRTLNEGTTEAITEDFSTVKNGQTKALTKEDIRQLLSHGNVRDRAFALCLLSSGCRAGEMLALKLEDINFETEPVQATIRREYIEGKGFTVKTKKPRTVFFSSEAVAAIREYQKVREQQLATSKSKIKNINVYKKSKNMKLAKGCDEECLFPYQYQTMLLGLKRMLKNANLFKVDKTTGRTTYRFHIYRKFFSKYMPSKMDRDMVEILLGHTLKNQGVYKNYSVEELAAEYKKAEFVVSIYDEKDTSALTTSMSEKDKKIEELSQQLFEARSSFTSFKTQMEDMKVKMKEELLAELIEALGPQHEKVQDFCYNETEQ